MMMIKQWQQSQMMMICLSTSHSARECREVLLPGECAYSVCPALCSSVCKFLIHGYLCHTKTVDDDDDDDEGEWYCCVSVYLAVPVPVQDVQISTSSQLLEQLIEQPPYLLSAFLSSHPQLTLNHSGSLHLLWKSTYLSVIVELFSL